MTQSNAEDSTFGRDERDGQYDVLLDSVCDEFARKWREGRRPSIDEYLLKAPPHLRNELFADLLDEVLRKPLEQSDAPGKEELQRKFPEYQQIIAQKFSLASNASISPPPLPTVIGRFQIVRELGQGSFGRVYLANDPQLERQVAIKVPRQGLFETATDRDKFLSEARLAARVRADGIVSVYDLVEQDGLIAVVSEYVPGVTLREWISTRNEKISHGESAQLVEHLAEALSVAHQQGLFHRDIKPENILIASDGRPKIVDFGMAIDDRRRLQNVGRREGSPAYMSPEQIRGESNRLDGRSDIWALGVILYEMLCRRRPFSAPTREELFDQIEFVEPVPLRQIAPDIPEELSRICLKCLSKKQSDRYTSALDLANDLREWPKVRSRSRPVELQAIESQSTIAQIVPKGLRSFDRHDASFYLQLLPGPRDRDGVPDSIRFWKHLIEDRLALSAVPVALFYGPSGCGKSSMFKAGVLPRLESRVRTVYLEATGEKTETQLTMLLKRQFDLETETSELVDVAIELRRKLQGGEGLKCVMVLDQFEQWLNSNVIEPKSSLVAALRQCDGIHIQAILMVRDDFWMPATRLFEELEIPLRIGQNAKSFDLFSERHASKILFEFGKAYGCLPETESLMTDEQRSVLTHALAGLSQKGLFYSVQLALFAELMSKRAWTLANFRSVGGTEGLGVNFLEETFNSPSSEPEYRRLQNSAKIVLKALLPPVHSDIKGHSVSYDDLANRTQLRDRLVEFNELLRILDRELRLITPTRTAISSSDSGTDSDRSTNEESRSYQLTHDYLVSSVRSWIDRKQHETARGRAELRLEERSQWWNSRREIRFLPSLLETLSIWWHTASRDWTPSQKDMMHSARNHYGRVIGSWVILAVAVFLGGLWTWQQFESAKRLAMEQTRIQGLVDSLMRSSSTQIPTILAELERCEGSDEQLLRKALEAAKLGTNERYHLVLRLLEYDASFLPEVIEFLWSAEPDYLPWIRDALSDYSSTLTELLWGTLESDESETVSKKLRAACMLATFQPSDPKWEVLASSISEHLVQVNLLHVPQWRELLRPISSWLVPHLSRIFRDGTRSEYEKTVVTSVLVDYVQADPDRVVDLLCDADERAFQPLLERASHLGQPCIDRLKTVLDRDRFLDRRPPDYRELQESIPSDILDELTRNQGIWFRGGVMCPSVLEPDVFRLSQALVSAGYRLVRVRPIEQFYDAASTRYTVVWKRSSLETRFALGLSENQLRETDLENIEAGFHIVDLSICRDQNQQPRCNAIWQPIADSSKPNHWYLLPERGLQESLDAISAPPFQDHLSVHSSCTRIGPPLFCGVFAESQKAWITIWRASERKYQFARSPGRVLVDLTISRAAPLLDLESWCHEQFDRNDDGSDWSGGNSEQAMEYAIAHIFRRQSEKGLLILNSILEKQSDLLLARFWRMIAYLQNGSIQESRNDLEELSRTQLETDLVPFLQALLVSKEQPSEFVLQLLDDAINTGNPTPDRFFNLACTYSILAFLAEDQLDKTTYENRAIDSLATAMEMNLNVAQLALNELDFLPLRQHPRFLRIIFGDDHQIRISAIWRSLPQLESTERMAETFEDLNIIAKEMSQAGYELATASPIYDESKGPLEDNEDGGPLGFATVWHRPVPTTEELDRFAQRAANAAIALARLGHPESLWKLLERSSDGSARSYLIDRMAERGIEFSLLWERLSVELRPDVRSAIIQSLEQHNTVMTSAAWVTQIETLVLDTLLKAEDPEERSSAEWLLSVLGREKTLEHARRTWIPNQIRQDAQGFGWYVDRLGQTFSITPGGTFLMGAPNVENGRNDILEEPHFRKIPHRFAIATHEVTARQFRKFLEAKNRRADEPSELPQGYVTWYQAAEYCNWLSELNEIPQEEWCYGPNARGLYESGMEIKPNHLERTGYRLPTEAEWEFACRAGTTTARFFGHSDRLMPKYTWFLNNSQNELHRVGQLRPNPLGLFDIQGNVCEWVEDMFRFNTFLETEAERTRRENLSYADNNMLRQYRGGAHYYWPEGIRSAHRRDNHPTISHLYLGFRPARTLPQTSTSSNSAN